MNIESVNSENNFYSQSAAAILDEPQSKVAQAFHKRKPDLCISIPEDDSVINSIGVRAPRIVSDLEKESEMGLRDEVCSVRVNRCLELFKSEQVEAAMKWAKNTDPSQKLDLCKRLIEERYYEDAVRVARLMGHKYKSDPNYKEIREIAKLLNNKRQHDFAVELIFEIPSVGFEFYILLETQYLIERDRDDLAMKLAVSKLNDDYRYKLCEALIYDGRFDKVVAVAHLIDEEGLILKTCEQLTEQGQKALAEELAAAKLAGKRGLEL